MKMHIMLLFMGLFSVGFVRASDVNTADMVSEALVEGREISFNYHGYARVVQPHALGEAGEGKAALLAYQVSGDSEKGTPPGWRVFLVAEIQSPALRDQTFACRGDFLGEGRGLKRITQRVKGASSED